MTWTQHWALFGAAVAVVFAVGPLVGEEQKCPATSSSRSHCNLGPALIQRGTRISQTIGAGKGTGKHVRVGIVTMSYHAAERNVWLYYHLTYVGVDHIFMAVEDAHGVSKMLSKMDAKLKERVTLWRSDGVVMRKYGHQIWQRQAAAATRAMLAAHELGLDWVFHIDDDELLYSPKGFPIGEAIKQAQLASNIDMLVLPNVESVYEPEDTTRCFSSAKLMNANSSTYVAYGNGKAGARVGTGHRAMEGFGVHEWHYSQNNVPCDNATLIDQGYACESGVPTKFLDLGLPKSEADLPTLMIVHYESCTVQHWIDKFWRDRNTSTKELAKIPFPYYRASIRRIKMCSDKAATDNVSEKIAPGCNRTEMAQVWIEWKTTANPKWKTNKLLPINIPWTQIYQAA